MINELFESMKPDMTQEEFFTLLLDTALKQEHPDIEYIDCRMNYKRAKAICKCLRKYRRIFKNRRRAALHDINTLLKESQNIPELDQLIDTYFALDQCVNFYTVEYYVTRYELKEYRNYLIDGLMVIEYWLNEGRQDDIDHNCSKKDKKFKEEFEAFREFLANLPASIEDFMEQQKINFYPDPYSPASLTDDHASDTVKDITNDGNSSSKN